MLRMRFSMTFLVLAHLAFVTGEGPFSQLRWRKEWWFMWNITWRCRNANKKAQVFHDTWSKIENPIETVAFFLLYSGYLGYPATSSICWHPYSPWCTFPPTFRECLLVFAKALARGAHCNLSTARSRQQVDCATSWYPKDLPSEFWFRCFSSLLFKCLLYIRL